MSATLSSNASPSAGPERSEGVWAAAWRRYKADRVGMVSLVIVLIFMVLIAASALDLVAKDWQKEVGVPNAPPTLLGPAPPEATGVIEQPKGPNVDISAIDPLAPKYAEWAEKAKTYATADTVKAETLPLGGDRLGYPNVSMYNDPKAEELRAFHRSGGTTEDREHAAKTAGEYRRSQLMAEVDRGNLSVLGGQFSIFSTQARLIASASPARIVARVDCTASELGHMYNGELHGTRTNPATPTGAPPAGRRAPDRDRPPVGGDRARRHRGAAHRLRTAHRRRRRRRHADLQYAELVKLSEHSPRKQKQLLKISIARAVRDGHGFVQVACLDASKILHLHSARHAL